MSGHALGRLYTDGECIVYEGDPSESLFVVQEGRVEIAYDEAHGTARLAVLEAGDLFGESALFSREPRTANVRALGDARILTIDRRVLLQRLKEDPLLALQILEGMHRRIRSLEDEIRRLRGGAEDANGAARPGTGSPGSEAG